MQDSKKHTDKSAAHAQKGAHNDEHKTEHIPESKLIADRIVKLKKIRDLGVNPYPYKFHKTSDINSIKEKHKALAPHTETGDSVSIAGRIMTVRDMGKAAFANLKDDSGNIQIYVRKDAVGDAQYELFTLIDLGDIAGVSGKIFTTKTGELSIFADKIELLSKSLRPLPDKWHGLQDEEAKLRKRYLDILFNDDIRDMIKKRSVFWNSMREFLLGKGFIEVETPVLENTTGGADAKPFITHHNALNMDVYLRISMGELWQKRLMVAGLEKTFEIGRQFRNEGMDAEHLQDYTQMEFYWAYADYEDGMLLVEDMYKYIILKTFGTLQFRIKDFDIDFGKKWERYDYRETVKKMTGIDVLNTNLEEVEKKLKELKIVYDRKGFNKTRAIDNLWKYCRKQIAGPGFLMHVPVEISPLAKRLDSNSELTQRFQPIIAGSEVGNGYSELNDPIDQRERFMEQARLREQGDEEAQMNDSDFVEAIEYAMPPTCGFGVSERLFSFLMNKPARECQIFPLMKPEIAEDKKQ